MKTYNPKVETKESEAAAVLKAAAIIVLIVGIILGVKAFVAEMLLVAVTCFVTTVIVAILLFALGEIIQLLSDLKRLKYEEKEEQI